MGHSESQYRKVGDTGTQCWCLGRGVEIEIVSVMGVDGVGG